MKMIRASTHQGHLKFKGSGRQCMANAAQAVLHSYDVSPKFWKSNTLDDVLEAGDDLYISVITSNEKLLNCKYLTVDDIPSSLINISGSYSGPLHGEPDEPYCKLNLAFEKLTKNMSKVGLIFTMGTGQPCYSSAVIKSEDKYYFFDPHSRNDSGMQTAEGTAVLTEHKNIEELCLFIRHLAASLKETGAVPYELVKVSPWKPEVEHLSSDSEFSGFDEMSDGECACKLYLADEISKNVQCSDSDVSDLTSIDSESEVLHSSEADQIIDNLNDSVTFCNQINTSMFDTYCDNNDQDHVLFSHDNDSSFSEGNKLNTSVEIGCQSRQGERVKEAEHSIEQTNDTCVGEMNDGDRRCVSARQEIGKIKVNMALNRENGKGSERLERVEDSINDFQDRYEYESEAQVRSPDRINSDMKCFQSKQEKGQGYVDVARQEYQESERQKKGHNFVYVDNIHVKYQESDGQVIGQSYDDVDRESEEQVNGDGHVDVSTEEYMESEGQVKSQGYIPLDREKYHMAEGQLKGNGYVNVNSEECQESGEQVKGTGSVDVDRVEYEGAVGHVTNECYEDKSRELCQKSDGAVKGNGYIDMDKEKVVESEGQVKGHGCVDADTEAGMESEGQVKSQSNFSVGREMYQGSEEQVKGQGYKDVNIEENHKSEGQVTGHGHVDEDRKECLESDGQVKGHGYVDADRGVHGIRRAGKRSWL